MYISEHGQRSLIMHLYLYHAYISELWYTYYINFAYVVVL